MSCYRKKYTLYLTFAGSIFAMTAMLAASGLWPEPVNARQQIHHPNALCQDYIVIKLQEYLDVTPNVNMDAYSNYKQELINYCDRMISCREGTVGYDAAPYDAAPESSYQPSSGISNYKLNLD